MNITSPVPLPAAHPVSLRLLAFWPFWLLGLAGMSGAQGATHLTTPPDPAGDAVTARWALPGAAATVPVFVNPNRPAGAAVLQGPATDAAALSGTVFQALQEWNETGSALRLRYAGELDVGAGVDGRNVVDFDPPDTEFPADAPGILARLTVAAAAGPVDTDTGVTLNAEFAGQILDADLLVDPNAPFAVGLDQPSDATAFDLLGTLVNRLGAVAGLDGSGNAQAAMYGYALAERGFGTRVPRADDRLALRTLYPTSRFLAGTGTVTGVVRSAVGAPLVGVQIVAVDSATGVVAASTLSGIAEFDSAGRAFRWRRDAGGYSLGGLAPGAYRLLAEPLDGPGAFAAGGVFAAGLAADLTPTDGPAVTVAAGDLISGIDLNINPAPPFAPNLNTVVFASNAGGDFEAPVVVEAGSDATLSAAGDNLLADGLAIGGARLTSDGSGVAFDNLTVRSADLLFPVAVAADSPPGDRVLRFSNDNGSSVITGGLHVAARPDPNRDVQLLAAVLPSSRAVQSGSAATAFASVLNNGTSPAANCRLRPLRALPGLFEYRETDPASNAVIGERDAAFNLPAAGQRTFVFAFTPSAAFEQAEVTLDYLCANDDRALRIAGLNSLRLTASDTPIADVIALSATLSNDGIVRLPGPEGSGFFTLASANVGSADALTVRLDTGSAAVPLALTLCATNPVTAACEQPAQAPPLAVNLGAGATATFAVFVSASGPVTLDPANSRVFVRFVNGAGIETGSTSVAVTTDS